MFARLEEDSIGTGRWIAAVLGESEHKMESG
jgi:hypothetical protein